MGTDHSKAKAEEEQRKAETKLDKCVEFIRGIIAGDVITDAEFKALDKYRQTESINNATYEKALAKLGLTLKDVNDKRQQTVILYPTMPPKKRPTTTVTNTQHIANTYVDSRSIHIHNHNHNESKTNKKQPLMIESMGIKQLQENCRTFSLKISGNKNELQLRIIEYLNENNINEMSVKELKEKCRIFQLKISGNKKDVQKRLIEYGNNQKINNKNGKQKALEYKSNKKGKKRALDNSNNENDCKPSKKKRKISEPPKMISSQRINKMGVVELKEKCKQYGLKCSGVKVELQDRLKKYFNDASSQRINKMGVVELKEKCKQYGLKSSGLKAELQDRLKTHCNFFYDDSSSGSSSSGSYSSDSDFDSCSSSSD